MRNKKRTDYYILIRKRKKERKMSRWNTIILREGFEVLTDKEFKNFEKGNTIYGADSNAKEVKRWSIEQEEAKAELAKLTCEYANGYITEYALEYCECDEDGEFICGSDFELAEEKERGEMEKFELLRRNTIESAATALTGGKESKEVEEDRELEI